MIAISRPLEYLLDYLRYLEDRRKVIGWEDRQHDLWDRGKPIRLLSEEDKGLILRVASYETAE